MDCLAGIGITWVPVDNVEDDVEAARQAFDPLDYFPTHRSSGVSKKVAEENAWAEIRAISYNGGVGMPGYVIPHRGDMDGDGNNKEVDKTMYISGLHDVSEDNLPSLMGEAFPREGMNYPWLRLHDGRYLRSLRPGAGLFRNLGNLVPNGISSEESAAMLALYQAAGAELPSDIKARIHESVELSTNNNTLRNAADRYRRDNGGGFHFSRGNGGFKSKTSLNQQDQATLELMMADPAKMLHRVVWEVDNEGQHMRQPRPHPLKQKKDSREPWDNYKGLWYPVPAARPVSGRLKTLCDFAGIKNRPNLNDYFATHPDANVTDDIEEEGG